MGLGLSRSQEQNPVEENDVPENPVVPDNANIQRHLNPEINLRRNNTGPDIDINQDKVIQRRGTKRKQRSNTAQEYDRLPTFSGDSASRHEMNGLRSGDQNVVDEVNIDDEEENEFDDILHTPKRRKLKTTTRYIFETLFLEGQDSDITLFALNREWKLHKLYLQQSPYFRSMFSGSWKESHMEKIDIHIVDPNIDLNSLHIALGSLYQDEITVEPAEVISILAAANLFQLDGLIDQCVLIMEETINVRTVARYFETAILYGTKEIETACLNWLKVNLLSHLPEHPEYLRNISINLMEKLIKSPDLFVMQTEFSVYVLLRLWLFLTFHHSWKGDPQDAVLMSHKFFQERAKNTKKFFLETIEGQQYVSVFKKLRLNHLVNHHMDMEMLLTDRILPKKWMYPVYQRQWQLLLRTDQGIDRGPQNFTSEEFDKVCLRCGRTLNMSGQQHMWRWTGFNMGLDLIVTYDNGNLSLKRNISSTSNATGTGSVNANGEHEALLSNHKKRHVYFRVSVASLNEQKQVTYQATSDIQSVSLNRNTSHQMLRIDLNKATFPLLLSFNFSVSTPLSIKDDDIEDDVLENSPNSSNLSEHNTNSLHDNPASDMSQGENRQINLI